MSGDPDDLQAHVPASPLLAFLHTRAPAGAYPGPVQFARVGEGHSNLTFALDFANGARLVLRRPPPGPLPPSAHDVLREFRVISALSGSPVPAPRPVLACADPAVIGAPFYLMEMVPGEPLRFTLPPAYAAAPASLKYIGDQTVDALVAIHQLDPATLGLSDLGRPQGYLARQIRRWRGQLDFARTRPVPDLDWLGDWLEAHLPAESGATALVHGDYKLDNLIFSVAPPARLLAVVDWEMATLGDPLADLGWLLSFWREQEDDPPELESAPRVTEAPGFPRRRALIARYAAAMGRPELTEQSLGFYIILAMWKRSVLLEGHWSRQVRGNAGPFDFRYLEHQNPAFAAATRRRAERLS